MKAKDSQLEEMEHSVTLLETVRLEQMEELEKKLKFATDLLETVKDIDGDKGKDLEEELKTECQMKKNMEVRLLKLEEKLKHKDDENQKIKKDALDTKQEMEKVVEWKDHSRSSTFKDDKQIRGFAVPVVTLEGKSTERKGG